MAGGKLGEDEFVLWRTELGPEWPWVGQPTVSGSRLFAVVDHDLVALDSRNGELLWRTRVTRPPAFTENIVIHRGTLFVAGVDSVFAIDEASGEVRWRVSPDDSSAAGAHHLADERALYVGTRAHRLHSLAFDDGRTNWSVDLGPAWSQLGTVQGIARSGDTLYVSMARWLDRGGLQIRGVVVAIDRRDGREYWRNETATAGAYDDAPTISGDLLLLADVEGAAFVALDRWSGEQVWRTPTTPGYMGPRRSPVALGDRVYGVSRDAYAYAMRRSDGRVMWRTRTGASNDHFALCGGSLLAESGGIAVVQIATGRLVRVLLDDPDDNTASGIVVSGSRAWTVGNRAAYAFRCG